MNPDRFEQAAEVAFAFLEDDFGMSRKTQSAADRRKHWWGRYVTYTSHRVFVRIELDNKDRAFNILLGPLVNGTSRPIPSSSNARTSR